MKLFNGVWRNNQLINLIFKDDFNKIIDYNSLPFKNIATLIFGKNFNQPLCNLPESLLSIEIRCFSGIDSFNQSVDNLPRGFRSLYLGHAFNKYVNKLPAGLNSLSLGNCFNQTVNKLPSTLEYLTLGHNFNRAIDNLPNLTNLELGYGFNKSLKKLPLKLEYLTTRDKNMDMKILLRLTSLKRLIVDNNMIFDDDSDFEEY